MPDKKIQAPGTRYLSEFVSKKILTDAESSGLKSHETFIYGKKAKENQTPEQIFRRANKEFFIKTATPDAVLKNKSLSADSLQEKIRESEVIAAREVVVQNFFRLFHSPQPKTTLVINDEDRLLVASASVPNAQSLEVNREQLKRIKEGIETGGYTGLGVISTLAILFNEIDFKPGNILINENNEIIKIDGDWALARLRGYGDKDILGISANILEFLPAHSSYDAYNWLTTQRQGEDNTVNQTFIDIDLVTNSNVRDEIMSTLLKVWVFPNFFIEDFVKHYVSDENEVNLIKDEITNRFDAMRQSAALLPEFQEYILTNEKAKEVVKTFKNEVQQFTLTHSEPLVTNSKELEEIENYYKYLQNEISNHINLIQNTYDLLKNDGFTLDDDNTLLEECAKLILLPPEQMREVLSNQLSSEDINQIHIQMSDKNKIFNNFDNMNTADLNNQYNEVMKILPEIFIEKLKFLDDVLNADEDDRINYIHNLIDLGEMSSKELFKYLYNNKNAKQITELLDHLKNYESDYKKEGIIVSPLIIELQALDQLLLIKQMADMLARARNFVVAGNALFGKINPHVQGINDVIDLHFEALKMIDQDKDQIEKSLRSIYNITQNNPNKQPAPIAKFLTTFGGLINDKLGISNQLEKQNINRPTLK